MYLDVKFKWKLRTIQEICFNSFYRTKKELFEIFKNHNFNFYNVDLNLIARLTFYVILSSFYFALNFINEDFKYYFMTDSLNNYYAHYEKNNIDNPQFKIECSSIINDFCVIFCLPKGYSIKEQPLFLNINVVNKRYKEKCYTNMFLFYIKTILTIIDGFQLKGFTFEMINDIEIKFAPETELCIVVQEIYYVLIKLFADFAEVKSAIIKIKRYKHNKNSLDSGEKIDIFKDRN